MFKCKQCNIEKELTNSNFYKTNSKFGYDKICKNCRKLNKDNKPKFKDKGIKYCKTFKLINPTHPIPVKKFADDGYGGKWKFDITKLTNDQLTFAKQHGLINHMSKSRIPCYQVKHVNLVSMQLFCDFVGMNRKAIIHFDKEENVKPVYVVNLYHQNIRMVLR